MEMLYDVIFIFWFLLVFTEDSEFQILSEYNKIHCILNFLFLYLTKTENKTQQF